MASDIALLEVQLRTGFVFDRSGRMTRTNDPNHSRAPIFILSGCASGNLCAVRADVTDDIAAQVLSLAASEPPFMDGTGEPMHVVRYRALLSADAFLPEVNLGVTNVLSNNIAYEHDVQLVCSDSDEGQNLRASWAVRGIPIGLKAMGFVDVAEFWEPWCVALHEGEAASVAFAARLSESGAGLGLATAPAFRGRGYGAAATAGWTRIASLHTRALFYSTAQTNASSQRVIARLGLRFLGASVELS